MEVKKDKKLWNATAIGLALVSLMTIVGVSLKIVLPLLIVLLGIVSYLSKNLEFDDKQDD